MIVSLNPTYLCNFRCNFCYLTDEQLGDKHKIELPILDRLLAEISDNTTIDHIDLYGGEIGVLPIPYFYEMKQVIRKYYDKPINIISNLYRVPHFLLDEDITLSVSYDFECREHDDRVFLNMAIPRKDIHVLVLASKCVIQQDVDYMISLLNMLANVKTVEIKPYSTNQANQQAVSHRDFEEFVKKWIVSPVKKRFAFINEHKIQSSLNKTYNAFSDDHIYITPQGQFAVLDFDLNDNEHFRVVPDFQAYKQWCHEEKNRVFANQFCGKCEFLGHCQTEHLRNVKSLDKSCNGYKFLLEWFRDKRMEN
jgi:sulfatase maturation enzyme AslB (radical SAM superfamily)